MTESGIEVGPSPAPRVFLSFARKDDYWVGPFKERLKGRLGPVVVQDVLAEPNVPFAELAGCVDQRTAQARVVIALLSRNYCTSKWASAGWRISLSEAPLRNLLFVAVMMDADAQQWWN